MTSTSVFGSKPDAQRAAVRTGLTVTHRVRMRGTGSSRYLAIA